MPTPFEWFALTASALFCKMYGVAVYQGWVRSTADQFTRPEDAEFFLDEGEPAAEDVEAADRAQRVLRNDVENVPVFLFLAFCFVQMGLWPAAVPVYLGIFVAARIVHTFAYLSASQPTRSIAFGTGSLVEVLIVGHIVYAVVAG